MRWQYEVDSMVCEGARQSVAGMIFLFLATLGYIGSHDEQESEQEKRLVDVDARSWARYRRTPSIVCWEVMRHSRGVSYLVLHETARKRLSGQVPNSHVISAHFSGCYPLWLSCTCISSRTSVDVDGFPRRLCFAWGLLFPFGLGCLTLRSATHADCPHFPLHSKVALSPYDPRTACSLLSPLRSDEAVYEYISRPSQVRNNLFFLSSPNFLKSLVSYLSSEPRSLEHRTLVSPTNLKTTHTYTRALQPRRCTSLSFLPLLLLLAPSSPTSQASSTISQCSRELPLKSVLRALATTFSVLLFASREMELRSFAVPISEREPLKSPSPSQEELRPWMLLSPKSSPMLRTF